ncbi:Membrane-anchored ubiquitin-fold protein 4 [Linum grandiflorum]
MPEEDFVELKFRLYDGTDIGPFRYSPASTVAVLKERIVAEWPKGLYCTWSCNLTVDETVLFLDKKTAPKGANDIKLINAGKILENTKTVGQCRAPFGELPNSVITMHVVVQPSPVKAKTEKKVDDGPRKNLCSCTIL